MPVTVADIHRFFESWAPREIAWDRDNPGLQTGDLRGRVRGILLALDATEEIVDEARRRGATLVVTHHPLLYRPARSVTAHTPQGRVLLAAARGGISIYSAHTNLDFTRGGTSFALGDLLGLREMRFLNAPYRRSAKIVTFVPAADADRVAAAMTAAGAGRIGNYDACSFRSPGTGTFRGNSRSRPVIGARGRLERVEEIRLEMVTTRSTVNRVLTALRRAHPYEEPALDVFSLENTDPDSGMGVIGTLPRATPLATFLRSLKRKLGTGALRWTGNARADIRIVAVCGGGGSELLEEAVRAGAQVFVTADVSYHRFHEAAGRIALVDAGHFETEVPVLRTVASRLREMLRRERRAVPVLLTRRSTNPVASL